MVPDYYAMLGVDPHADRAAIEAAMERCRHQWSSGTRNPKYKHTYQSYLDQVPEIRRRLLTEPATRTAYDAELKAEFDSRRTAKLDELQRLIRLRAAKGGLTVSDRNLLRDRTTSLGLTADDLARLIEPIPPKPESPALDEPDEVVDDGLDPVTRRQIRTALELVGKRDLYDALGLVRDAPAHEIAARADAERQKWMRKSQVTAEKTAWLEVISYAQSHLAHPSGRVRYERTLVRETEDDFGRTLAFALEGVSALDPGTRSVLIEEAESRGITSDRADQLIAIACRAGGVSRDGGLSSGPPIGDVLPRHLRCRECGGVTEFGRVGKNPDQAACRHCRASLRWDCPVCRKRHWVDEPRCHCGFEVRNLEPFNRHFEAAQHAFKIRDYDASKEHLARAQDFAPHHVGARKAVEKVEDRLAEIEARKTDFELARSRKNLVEARGYLSAWRELVAPGSPALLASQADLFGKLREAEGYVARAKDVEATDPKAARTFFRHALALAADLSEAREGLHRSPPDPPLAPHAALAGSVVVIRWTPPAPDGLGPWSFRVVRKVDGVPTQVNDGTLVAESEGTEVVDQSPPNGKTVGYAIFTVRGRVVSASPASVPPIPIVLEVADLRAEGSHGEIALNWRLPEGARGARVVRIGASKSSDVSIESLAEHALDQGLDDSRIYRYRVAAVYPGENGRPIVSAGVEIAANPAPPVGPAGPLSVVPEVEGGITLRWPSGSRGSVKVLRTLQPLVLSHGSRISASEAANLAGTWLDALRPDSTTDPEPPTVGICHYTPFVFHNGTATVGTGVGYSSVPDPSDLRAVRVGSAGRVHLRWRWAPRATETIVVGRSGAPPRRPDEDGVVVATVSEADYSRQGYFTLNLPAESKGGPWHLAVFSLSVVEGIKLTSPGLEPTARTIVPGPTPEITVSYTLRRPTFPGRAWSILIRTDPPGSSVPPTALVVHPRTVPLSSDDGQVVERFPACQDGATFAVKPLVDLSRQRARLFADPTVDPAGQTPIRLRHPESAATRV
jgi:hypothetical protein